MKYKLKPIKNNNDYEEVLTIVEELIMLDPEPDTEESDTLTILSILVENYEKTNYPLEIPTAIEAIKFRMEQLDLRPVNLIPYLGSASRVSEILSGKRGLTIKMINALSEGLGIPLAALLNNKRNKSSYSKIKPRSVINNDISIIAGETVIEYK